MTKTHYTFLLNDKAYDLSASAPLPLEELSKSELAEAYNRMCTVAGGVPNFSPERAQPVKSFSDKPAGVKRIAALHSSLVAFAAGQRQAEEQEKPRRAAAKVKAEAKVTEVATEPKAKTEKESKAPKEPKAENAEPKVRGAMRTFELKVIRLGSVPLRSSTKRYAAYRDGMTVAEYLKEATANSIKAGRKGRNGEPVTTHELLAAGDVRYDAARGVITLQG